MYDCIYLVYADTKGTKVYDCIYLVYADTKGWVTKVYDCIYLVYADTKGWVTKNSPALTNIYSHCLSFSIYKPKQYQSLKGPHLYLILKSLIST